jgi:hypothetical protein
MKFSCNFLLTHSGTQLHSAELNTELPVAVSYRELTWTEVNLKLKTVMSKSKSHCDWRSVSQSVSLGVEPHLGLMTDIYYSLTVTARGRVCLLYMPLALASAVILGSESLGTRDHILLSQVWDFPFRHLLRLAGWRWRYSTPPPHG